MMAVRGVAGQQVELDVVAPAALSDIRVNGTPLSITSVATMDDAQAAVIRIRWTLRATTAEVTVRP
jgi:hypothetical protein